MSIIKDLFGDCRILGLAGAKSSGKTNNLVALVREFRNFNKDTPIYVYGVNETTINYLKRLGNVYEVSTLEQLSDKENCLLIVEEFQKLKLNDRRYRDTLNQFIDFVYHRNCWVIFSSPSLREYNSVIGGKIERWCLKSLRLTDLVNGSQLKSAVMRYNGRFKTLNDIKTPVDTILVMNDEYEQVIKVPYIKEVDTKALNINIFDEKKVEENVEVKVKTKDEKK